MSFCIFSKNCELLKSELFIEHGLVVKVLDSQSRVHVFKTIACFQDRVSLSLNCLLKVVQALRQLNPNHKKGS